MRVAMLSIHSGPLANLGGKEAGGMNVYVRELSRELGQRGISVDIFTRSQDPLAPLIVPLDRNVRVINLHTGPMAPYNKNWVLDYLPEFISRVRCFADGEDLIYDIIHSHYWLSGEAGLALRRSWGVPVVHMFHTLGVMKNHVARSSEESETSGRITIERRLMSDADAIVAATPLDRAQMLEHYHADPTRIHTIPCGVDLRRFSPQEATSPRAALGLPAAPHRIILQVGRIEPLKGFDGLIRAVALLLEEHPTWRGELTALIVGGAGENEPEQWNAEQRRLDGLRTELGVHDAIQFVGTRTQEQLPQFYAAADIVTMPSHYESFGIAALEGMACGRPVIATNAGGPAFVIEDGLNGVLVTPHEASTLARHLERLLLDSAQRTAIGAAARERAQRFGWTTIAHEIIGVYENTLEAATLRQSVALLGCARAHSFCERACGTSAPPAIRRQTPPMPGAAM